MKKIFIYLLIIIVAAACKPTQKLAVQNVSKSPADELIQNIKSNDPAIRYATVKMNVDIEYNGRSFSSAANCKIRKDSAMHISIQPVFGVEMFKMEITPQKILIFDKLNKRYYETDFSFIESKLGEGMNFKNFQALVSNSYLNMVKTDSLNSDCFAREHTLVCQNKTLKQEMVTGADFRIQKLSLQYLKADQMMEAQYSDFNTADGILFPFKIAVQATRQGAKMRLNFNCSKVNFNSQPVFSANNIQQFTKSDIKQLMTK